MKKLHRPEYLANGKMINLRYQMINLRYHFRKIEDAHNSIFYLLNSFARIQTRSNFVPGHD